MEIFTNVQIYLLLNYAFKFLGTPYIWGGNSRLEGFDCSGFVQEILWYGGIDPYGDQTAQGLYDRLSVRDYRSRLGAGSVLFFGAARASISHVAIAIDDKRMIESGGGDSTCKTFIEAKNRNACVRISKIDFRNDLVACLMPDYKII